MDYPLYDRLPEGNCEFLGFKMSQSRVAVGLLSYILETGKFAQVIELGTQLGGLTVLLGLQCRMLGIRIDTFDHGDTRRYADWFEHLDIRFHQVDIFRPDGEAQVRERIVQPGRALLLCDNGNKVREFQTFAPSLKHGDVIGAHDYHPAGQYDERRWAWHEITDDAVQSACERHHLAPFMTHACTEAAWLMRVRTG